jgi:predicted metal-dependent enzyme (double-stranded beta helix superfamily)
MRSLIAAFFAVLLVVLPASAQTTEAAAPAMSLALPSVLLQQADAQGNAQDAGQPLHAAAVEHSDAYERRKKIHKYASFATLPLFATEFALGQSLYNTPANPGSKRALHGFVGAGIVGLFAVNTVTGAWNMFGEDRKDPEGRTRRLVHGLLMMAADTGFVITERLGPNSHSQRQALTFESRKATHRNVAIASISVGTAGYLLMLFGNH